MSWSTHFQTPNYLERTRLMLIEPELEPLIGKWCDIKEGSRVLDVGCGTGFFTRLLKRTVPGAKLMGLDAEENFVLRARGEAGKAGLDIDFLTGDAGALPFEENSFDVVVSHTFLTSAAKPAQVFGEMKRVLHPGGRIASVTPMNFRPHGGYVGAYPIECGWGKELMEMTKDLLMAYNKLAPLINFASGIPPAELPVFFARQGMKNICAYPLGKFFSLSNAAVPVEKKRLWLELYEKSEFEKLDTYMKMPEMRELFSEEKAERYRQLIREKCDYYRIRPEENAIWEWIGGSNLLVTGDT